MPRYEITSPEGRRFEVTAPDGASQDEVLAYAQNQFTPQAPISPTDSMSGKDKFLAGMGKGMVDLGRGAGQMFGMVDQKTIDEAKRLDAPLMNTGAGTVGNIAGTLAAALPAAFIPGANSVAGAAAMGGAFGAAQPIASDENTNRFQNIVTGAALGGGAQAGIGKLAKYAGDKLIGAEARGASQAAQNSVRDETLAEVIKAGYKVPPSLAGGGLVPRVMEGVSGKFKTNQAMAVENQNLTDTLARKALGLAEDQPITREAMQGVRDRAFQVGYEPVASAGSIETDRVFTQALNKITEDFQGAARSFPGGVKNDVMQRVDSLRTSVMDAGDALKMTRILRDESSSAFAKGDNAMGKATKGAAKAIEDQVERALEASGKDGKQMLENFRAARALMAKAHNVEKAIVEGGGQVNSKVLGAALQRGKPLTGELLTIGKFANNFGDVAGVPKSGWANPITALDAFGAAGMGAMGAGPMALALPAARVASRHALMSPRVQNSMAAHSYGPGLMQQMTPKMLEELKKRGAGGLLGLLANSQ